MSSRNGNKRIEQMRKEKQQKRQHQQQMKREQGALKQAFNADGEMSRDFIRELVSNDELEPGTPEGLQDETVAKLQNLLSRDWVLSNLTDAQEHDIRFKLEVLKLKIYGMHPPDESHVQGNLRAFLMGDRSERLRSLTQEERVLIDEFIETLKARFTRGREGFEREQMNTNIARTETGDDDGGGDGGGLRGIFG